MSPCWRCYTYCLYFSLPIHSSSYPVQSMVSVPVTPLELFLSRSLKTFLWPLPSFCFPYFLGSIWHCWLFWKLSPLLAFVTPWYLPQLGLFLLLATYMMIFPNITWQTLFFFLCYIFSQLFSWHQPPPTCNNSHILSLAHIFLKLHIHIFKYR